jgi:hypothetical protein
MYEALRRARNCREIARAMGVLLFIRSPEDSWKVPGLAFIDGGDGLILQRRRLNTFVSTSFLTFVSRTRPLSGPYREKRRVIAHVR